MSKRPNEISPCPFAPNKETLDEIIHSISSFVVVVVVVLLFFVVVLTTDLPS